MPLPLGNPQASSKGVPMRIETLQTCIEDCATCARECVRCLNGWIDHAELADCRRTCRECFSACILCLGDLRENSPNLVSTCLSCASACRRFAKECRDHDCEDCQRCAKVCRRCAQECRKVVGSMLRIAVSRRGACGSVAPIFAGLSRGGMHPVMAQPPRRP